MPCQRVQISGPEPEPEPEPPSQSDLFDRFEVEGGVNEATANFRLINPLTQPVSFDLITEVNGKEVNREGINLLGRQSHSDTMRATFDMAPGESELQEMCVMLENIQISG